MADETAAQHTAWRAWADRQLNDAGWTQEAEPSVRYIVDQFLGMGVIGMQRGTDQFRTAFALFVELLGDRALTAEHWTAERRVSDSFAGAVWTQVAPGQLLNRQDAVRVAPDAYMGGMAVHNGRTGTIMGVRHGVGVVHYTGDPPGSGVHHQIRHLQVPVVRG